MRNRWVVGGLLVVALAGCSQSSNAPQNPATSASSTAVTTTAVRPTPKPTPKTAPLHTATLPSDCALLLTHATVNKALGKTLTGRTIYIKGVAENNIGRTGRTTCRYGVRGKSVPIEVGVSGYRTAAEAAARVRVTISVERDGGALASSTKIGTQPATMLRGPDGALVLYGDSNRTVAVTLAHGVGGTKVATVLKMLATALAANLP